MRTPQELLEYAEVLLLDGMKRTYSSGSFYYTMAGRESYMIMASTHIQLANSLIRLEQANFADDLAKGLDSYGFSG